MVYDITNYQILATKDLRRDDILNFLLEDKTYTYLVEPRWLTCMSTSNETQILQDMKEIGVINETPMQFCWRTYGYIGNIDTPDSMWPEVKVGDFTALNRCAFEIFNLLYNYKESKNSSKIELTELALDIW